MQIVDGHVGAGASQLQRQPRPMPRAAPVTRAFFPCSFMVSFPSVAAS